eukprot:scaffold22331_cov76-Amphora_coffeaeformis.AAC.1
MDTKASSNTAADDDGDDSEGIEFHHSFLKMTTLTFHRNVEDFDWTLVPRLQWGGQRLGACTLSKY